MAKTNATSDPLARWQTEDKSLGYSLRWVGQGPAGSGKTHFLMTAPEPIAVFLFNDPGGVAKLKRKDEFKHRDIRWIDYSFNPGKLALADRPKAAKDEIERFIEDYATALTNFKTLGFDKEDSVYELLRYARLEAYTDRPASYYELNNEYAGWFHDAAAAGVNLGVLRGMKEKWGQNAKGQPTGLGISEPRGQKWVNEKVEIVLAHRWNHDDKTFSTMIAPPSAADEMDEGPKCRVGDNVKALIGEEFGDLDFMTLATMLYPDTTEADWTA